MDRHRLLSFVVVAGALLSAAACPPRKADPVPPTLPTTGQSPGPATATAPSEQPAAVAPSPFAPAPAGARAVVLYTASVQGYVEPCGCTAEPLGGVARFRAAVEDAHAAYGDRVVVLDAGDLLFEKPDDNRAADLCQAQARLDLLLDSTKQSGLVATVLGPLDDVRGAAFRDVRLASRGIPTVVGVDPSDFDGALMDHVPEFLAAGEMAAQEHTHAQDVMPRNSIAMLGGSGAFGYVTMGGMFSILKVRESRTPGDEAGWYEGPKETQADVATPEQLRADGIVE